MPPGFKVEGFYKESLSKESSLWFLTGKTKVHQFTPIQNAEIKDDELHYNDYGVEQPDFDKVISLSNIHLKKKTMSARKLSF